MAEITDNTIIITKDDGTEDSWKILFYYENEERKKTFYFVYKDEDPDSILVLWSADGKTVAEPDEEELAEAEEVLEAYESDPKIAAA
jgi:uncharacterized protein YrzB (UPF0473 family)